MECRYFPIVLLCLFRRACAILLLQFFLPCAAEFFQMVSFRFPHQNSSPSYVSHDHHASSPLTFITYNICDENAYQVSDCAGLSTFSLIPLCHTQMSCLASFLLRPRRHVLFLQNER